MLPKNRRLDRPSFLKVLNTPNNTTRLPDLQFRSIANGLGFNRYSVVVTKKISKLAVVRNTVKRNIYNEVKDIAGGYDIIIYPKNEKISSELHSLLSKLP